MGGAQTKAFEIDFENATPSGSEQAIYSRVSAILDRGTSILKALQSYVDCGDAIREAMGATGDVAKEEQAVQQVSQRVLQMKEWYDFSKEVEDVVPALLSDLSRGDLTEHAGLAVLMSRLLDFVLRFDELKMHAPKIMNDLAYYRRYLGKSKNTVQPAAAAVATSHSVGIEDAGRCQMFLSAPTPMMNAIAAATTRLHHGNETVIGTLPALANSCCHMVSKRRFQRSEVNERCMRAMVGAILLFDHVHPQGSYHRRSAINVRRCIQLLKTFDNPSPPAVLLDTIRYSSKHLDDDSTPAAIKKMVTG